MIQADVDAFIHLAIGTLIRIPVFVFILGTGSITGCHNSVVVGTQRNNIDTITGGYAGTGAGPGCGIRVTVLC